MLADYVTRENTWDWEKLSTILPNDCLELLVPIKAPDPLAGQDVLGWFLTTDGKFSTKSTYDYLVDWNSVVRSRIFSQMWKIRAPQRLKSFMWLALNDVLLTNMARHRRGLVFKQYMRLVW